MDTKQIPQLCFCTFLIRSNAGLHCFAQDQNMGEEVGTEGCVYVLKVEEMLLDDIQVLRSHQVYKAKRSLQH